MPTHLENCRVCKTKTEFVGLGTVLQRKVSYFECQNCGFVQTEEPNWLEEAYKETINISDTGIVSRNLANRSLVISTLFTLGGLDEKVVDFAGGYGLLVRLLRDKGVDAWHSDPYCENLVAAGFENDGSEGFLVTAFEAFEHFVDPGTELEKMFALAPNVLLSTNLISKPIPKFGDWWYYGAEHGQHISFYRKSTLQYLAKKHGKHLVSNGCDYHLFSDKPVSKLKWLMMLRGKRFMNFAARFLLKSKTWSDHLLMSRRD